MNTDENIEHIENSNENNVVNLNTENDLHSYLENLIQEKTRLAEEGKYVEAENVKRKIKELKDHIEGKKKKDLDYQHMNEIKNLEESYNREMNEFNELWDRRFKEFEERGRKSEDNLTDSHQKEMQDLYTLLEQTLPKVIKHSKEYLDLKQIEMGLVKQERYLEAHMIKTKADNTARIEEEKFNIEKNNKIKKKVDKMNKKHNLEKNALREKLNIEYEIMKKEKDHELTRIIHKFKNRKHELDTQQKQERLMNDNSNLMKAKTLTKFRPTKSVNHKYDFDPELRLKELTKSTGMRTSYTAKNSNNNYASSNNHYTAETNVNYEEDDNENRNAEYEIVQGEGGLSQNNSQD